MVVKYASLRVQTQDAAFFQLIIEVLENLKSDIPVRFSARAISNSALMLHVH